MKLGDRIAVSLLGESFMYNRASILQEQGWKQMPCGLLEVIGGRPGITVFLPQDYPLRRSECMAALTSDLCDFMNEFHYFYGRGQKEALGRRFAWQDTKPDVDYAIQHNIMDLHAQNKPAVSVSLPELGNHAVIWKCGELDVLDYLTAYSLTLR